MKKNILTCLAFFLVLGSLSCSSSVTPEEAKQKLAEVKPLAIPMDQPVEGAKIDTARNFYFVVDGSGSMTEQECGGDRTKVEGAKAAVHEFMAKVPTDINLGLYIFDYYGEREVVPLAANNQQQFLQEIDKLSASGGTPLAEAINFGTDKLVQQYKRQLGYGEFRLIVVTDGQASGLVEAVQYAYQYRIPVYTIGLCIGDSHPLHSLSVSYRSASNADDLKRGLEEVTAEVPFDPSAVPPAKP